MRTLWLCCIVLSLTVDASRAATVDAITSRDAPTLFVIQGELQYGDEKKFVDKAIGVPEGIVSFHSTVGNVVAGIEIGKAIRLKGFVTLVPDETACASACALAWLGGAPRFMAPKAKIGFHAAYLRNGSEFRESGAANALVGA